MGYKGLLLCVSEVTEWWKVFKEDYFFSYQFYVF